MYFLVLIVYKSFVPYPICSYTVVSKLKKLFSFKPVQAIMCFHLTEGIYKFNICSFSKKRTSEAWFFS